MASSVERGVTFSLPVGLSITPKSPIKPPQREQIFGSIKAGLPLFAKHLENIDEITFFKVITITIDAKYVIRLELSVSSLDDLERLLEYAKPVKDDAKNELSYALSVFFQNQDILLRCGFKSGLKINIAVVMTDKEKKKVKKELEKKGLTNIDSRASRQEDSSSSGPGEVKPVEHVVKSDGKHSKDNFSAITGVIDKFEQRSGYPGFMLGKNEQESRRRMTFIIDIPAKLDVTSVMIRSHTVEALNRELRLQRNNMYETTVELPFLTDPQSLYWYEIKFKDYFIFFFRSIKEYTSEKFVLGEKAINRDMLWEQESLLAHLNDIITYTDENCSNFELISQMEELCRRFGKLYVYQIKNILVKLLISEIVQFPEYLVRFAFVAGYLCKNVKSPLNGAVDSLAAYEILKVLSQKRLDEYPTSCQSYMPELSKHLLKISLEDKFCAVFFLSDLSNFLPNELLYSTLMDFIPKNEKIVIEEAHCEAVAYDICISFCKDYLETKSEAVKGIVELLCRHLPIQVVIDTYKGIFQICNCAADAEVAGDIFTAVTASLKSQVLAFVNKQIKESNIVALLKIATLLGKHMLTSDFNIQRTLEEGVIICCSSNSLAEIDFQSEMEDFLQFSGCFMKIDSQMNLLTSLSDSRKKAVRKLFLFLIENEILKQAYYSLGPDSYKRWLQNEIKESFQDEIPMAFKKLCVILKTPVVSDREDVRKTLTSVTTDMLKRFDLKAMLQQVEKIEVICEAEPMVSQLYKEHVKEQLNKKGLEPSEVLKLFCVGGNLRVNTCTTTEIVCTIIDLFFKKYVQEDLFESFVEFTAHSEFWELISKGIGTHIQYVQKNPTFIYAMYCFKHVSLLLKSNEIDVSVMRKMNVSGRKTEVLLQLGGLEKKDLKEIEKDFKEVVKDLEKAIDIVQIVLKEIQYRLTDKQILDLTSIQKEVTIIKDKIQSGSICIKECKTDKWLWGNLCYLPKVCMNLYPVITSEVLWNVSREKILETFDNSLHCGSALDGLLSIRFLFESSSEDGDIDDLLSEKHVLDFLDILIEVGIHLYEENWMVIEENHSVTMQSVQELFENANIPQEIKMAECFFKKELKPLLKTTLNRIWRKNELIEKANAMVAVLKVFGCDSAEGNDLNEALKSFQELVKQEFSVFTLHDVQMALQAIVSLADTLNDETVCIMKELGRSSVLLDFLKEIAVEDVRNLIDAVEDISESHVQESTVSAIIDVKRFLSPLLKQELLHEKGSQWIFETLKKQTQHFDKSASGIPSKISECSLNIHNLKSLYNNVANRGQQTKEIIKSIISKGKFVFSLCAEGDTISFEVSYKENKNTFTKHESTMSDIRSRALLLLNSERETSKSSVNQEEFKLFIEYVDLCIEIRDTLYDLYSSGHIKYATIELTMLSNVLKDTKDRLKMELENWLVITEDVRSKYYLMNFIQGCHVRVIYEFLENGTHHDIVEALMKYIHPSLSAKLLKDTFISKINLKDEKLVLEELGRSLHEIYGDQQICSKDMGSKSTGAKFTECVNKGKILVAQLSENSDFVVRTILALYRNTTNSLPEPSQVLFCTGETTWNEIELLLQRCKRSYGFYGLMPLYCIANVELLQNKVQFILVEELHKLQDAFMEFLLAIVCRGSKNHPFVDKLNDLVATIQPVSNQELENLLRTYNPNVFTYTSEVPGLGKTSSIYSRSFSHGRSTVTVHVSGQAKKRHLLANLSETKACNYHSLHFDIGVVDDPSELDTFLFELIVLKYIAFGKLAFYIPTDHICIEIGNTINDTLRTQLPTITAFNREHLLWDDFSNFICSKEINSPLQVVCLYLQALDEGVLDTDELCFSSKTHLQPLPDGTCRALLRKHMDVASDLSFSIVHIFLNVLSEQLKKMSYSAFFKVAHISEMVGKSTVPMIRSNLVKAMKDVSMEFAARSVNACRSIQNSTLSTGSTSSTESDPHDLVNKVVHRVDGMIRWEESNHLIYVFHSQNVHTLSPMYRYKKDVPMHIQKLFESQMKKNLPDFSSMNQDELQNMLQKVSRKKPLPLDKKQLQLLAKDYALTPDNLLKMVLIMMRIQSNVPVVIMGETGCGKTSLIRYLANICEVPFKVMNIHAGVHSAEILDIVMKENDECIGKPDHQRWLFLDEINTSEDIGFICDIICHHRCNGSYLAPNLVIMGACNPYKLRSIQAIHTAGLTGKVKTDDLSKLVYRVLPLPEMTVDYVWDFGSLSEQDEMKYIQRMVEGVFKTGTQEHSLFSDLLSISQSFVREEENSTCVVSLRDVQRCKTLVPWFITILKQKSLVYQHESKYKCDAIILALAHCYHCRFLRKSVRKKYREKLVEGFRRSSIGAISLETHIHDVIKSEQKNLIDRMDLPPGTAKNTALQENIFIILVCILNKIPVFVVGKPGCSKSLAMQIIRSNLRGKDSRDCFFKTLPQLYCVSFQGSESSTSDGIIKVFEKAVNYQKSNSGEPVLSVVILDEIGLAEVSRFNPLKVLHNLLEPEGRSRPDVAVVGISNWALDASKMNRAVHLSRPDMDAEELFETSMSISTSFLNTTNGNESLLLTGTKTAFSPDIKEELWLVAESYISYTNNLQFSNFHGLRDFYSLVKFIARKLASEPKTYKKSAVIMEGLYRNFGGLKSSRNVLLDHFKPCIQNTDPIDLSSVDLINGNIVDTMARHLMIVAKGDSVLGILEHNLRESGRERREIIFGSQFEEDLTDDYNYRILSKIILCMEQGVVLVLKDLENIYGSLYDMLNQNYTRIGKKNNCRVALGPYSNPFCHVADAFRCIVLIDENKVNYSDPPFLNRFEKQVLSFVDVMDSQEIRIVEELDNWLDCISQIQGKPFTKYSTMPFYNKELISSLVLFLKQKDHEHDLVTIDKCKEELLWIMRPEVIVRLSEVDDLDVQKSSGQIRSCYFKLPLHCGLGNLIHFQTNADNQNKMSVVFTHSNIHTNIMDELSNWSFQTEKLGTFKSEKQLSIKLQQFWKSDKQILLIHCSALEDDKHILLTKSLIEKYQLEYIESSKKPAQKYVYLVIHLGSRDSSFHSDDSSCLVSQINYLSGWKLLLLENLERPQITLPDYCSRTLFDTIEMMLPLTNIIKVELFWAFTRIQYGTHGRNAKSINHIIEKINTCHSFLGIINELIWSYVQNEHKGQDNEDWFIKIACDVKSLNTSAFFVDALDRHIKMIIKIPLAKVIFKLEQLGALDSFFIEDSLTSLRRELWCTNIKNEKVFSYTIEDKPIKDAAGPDCYQCDTPDLELRLPFSQVIFCSIEETKKIFTDEVARSKVKCELETDDALPDEIMSEIILQQESVILKQISDIFEEDHLTPLLMRDYVSDFCNLYSYTVSNVLEQETRIEYMRWTLEQRVDIGITDNVRLLTNIHCTGWSHATLFVSMIQMFELCSNIFKSESNILVQFQQFVKTFHALSENSGAESSEESAEDKNVQKPKPDTENDWPMFVTSATGAAIDDICVHKISEISTNKNDFENVFKEKDVESDVDSNALVTVLNNVINEDESKKNVKEGYKNDFTVDEQLDLCHHTDLQVGSSRDVITKDEKSDETLKCYPEEDNTNVEDNTIEITLDKNNTVLKHCGKGEADYSEEYESNDCMVKFGENDYTSPYEYNEKDKLQLNDDILSADQVQGFVSFLCTRMIPTSKSLSQFSGIKHWQMTVRNVLTIAAEVSTEPVALHSLRLCNDIVTDIILPFSLNLEPLYDISNSLVSSSVDSEEVFANLLNLFQCLKETESAAPVQRVICQFLIRCLSTNSETNAFSFLFKAIEECLIPEEEMYLLKAPLRFFVQQELEENENVFKDLAESDENRDILIECSLFLSSLDSCLYHLDEQDRIDSPFVLLIVDIIQETFENDENTEDTFDILLPAGQILQENEIGLAFVTALSYTKAAVSYITESISSSSQSEDDITSLLTKLNAVQNGLKNSNIYKPMLDYCLNVLGINSSIWCVRKYCKSQTLDDSFLEKVDWNDEFLSNCFESNPLAIELPKETLLKGEDFIKKEQSTKEFSTSVSQIILIVSKQKDQGLLLLYTLTMKRWYLSRHRKILDDIDRRHSGQLLEEMQKLNISSEQHKLIECLVGKKDFMSSLLMHDEESSFQQYMISSVLVSAYAHLLSNCSGSSGHSSLLSVCLLNPMETKTFFTKSSTSSQCESAQNLNFQNEGIFALCKCNRRLFFLGKENIVCTICGNEPKVDETEFSRTDNISTSHFNSHGISLTFSFPMKILTDVPLNIFMFLVKGCLLGSVSLEISKCSEMENIFGCEYAEIDITQQLECEIYNHWEDLKKSLNMDDHDVGIILHSVLHKGKDLLFKGKYSTLSESQKIQWEMELCTLISGLLKESSETIQKSLNECNEQYDLPKQCTELAIREAIEFINEEEDHHYEQFSTLLRRSVKPYREDFKRQLFFNSSNFPFLITYFEKEEEFNLPKHIYHIVQWHMATVVNISHLFKRLECLKMTVAEFHKNLSDLKKQKMSKNKFESFKNSWNIVKELLENTEEFSTILPITKETNMAQCLILDTTCDVYKVLSFLVGKQNGLIDLALQHSFTCNNLQFLLQNWDVACCKAVPITELKMEQLIDLSFDLDESLAQESNSGLAYGMGKQIFYDFQNIEKELCVDLLAGKAFVSLESLPSIVFTDELYKNFVALLSDVHHCIPQETLPVDIETSFVKMNQDTANMSFELLNFLDMVLSLLKQTKINPQKPLVEFVKERTNIVGQQIPSQYIPSTQSRVKICHIISLHELLEEMCVDRILDSLPEAYNIELDANMKEHFNKMPAVSIKKSEIVMKSMKKFVYRCIFMGDTDAEQQLTQYLSHKSFWPQQYFQNERLTIDGKNEDVKDIIPPCLLVCHIVAAVSTLSESIENQKQGEMRMDRVIASWKEKKPENTAKVTRQKKAVKKLRKT